MTTGWHARHRWAGHHGKLHPSLLLLTSRPKLSMILLQEHFRRAQYALLWLRVHASSAHTLLTDMHAGAVAVSEGLMRQHADYMVSLSLDKLGYVYLCVDGVPACQRLCAPAARKLADCCAPRCMVRAAAR